jgi:hypothetical protein
MSESEIRQLQTCSCTRSTALVQLAFKNNVVAMISWLVIDTESEGKERHLSEETSVNYHRSTFDTLITLSDTLPPGDVARIPSHWLSA